MTFLVGQTDVHYRQTYDVEKYYKLHENKTQQGSTCSYNMQECNNSYFSHRIALFYKQLSLDIKRENCLNFDTIHYCSVWIRDVYNPANINRFRSYTRNFFYET